MAVYAFEGNRPEISKLAYIHPSASVIGNVIIGDQCFIGPGAVIRADYGKICLGSGCAIEDNCIIHSEPDSIVLMENDIIVGHGACTWSLFDKKQFHHRHGIYHINRLRSWLLLFWPLAICCAGPAYSREPWPPATRPGPKAVDGSFCFIAKSTCHTVNSQNAILKGQTIKPLNCHQPGQPIAADNGLT